VERKVRGWKIGKGEEGVQIKEAGLVVEIALRLEKQ